MSQDKLNSIFDFEADNIIEKYAIKCFNHQYKYNPVYRDYINYLDIQISDIVSIEKIPFLPIEFFKSHRVFSGDGKHELQFHSSGTSGMMPSIHYVKDIELYKQSFINGFTHFYGKPDDYCFLGLLPSYLERENSSLVYMVNELIKKSRFNESGFYLDRLDKLAETIAGLEKRSVKTILIGVSYALLDLAQYHPIPLEHTILMETGGMKGKREELSKEQLHKSLSKAFGLKNIHSEYGMTELLSQAYSNEKGIFQSPPWMKILIRDPYDPFSYFEDGRSGGINIIDLANWHSCSFIETQDLGRMHNDNFFEVLGRFDSSDIRGCNLLVQ